MTERKNGCWCRLPFAKYITLSDGRPMLNYTHTKPECEYTKSDLGQADKGCNGCLWKKLK